MVCKFLIVPFPAKRLVSSGTVAFRARLRKAIPWKSLISQVVDATTHTNFHTLLHQCSQYIQLSWGKKCNYNSNYTSFICDVWWLYPWHLHDCGRCTTRHITYKFPSKFSGPQLQLLCDYLKQLDQHNRSMHSVANNVCLTKSTEHSCSVMSAAFHVKILLVAIKCTSWWKNKIAHSSIV